MALSRVMHVRFDDNPRCEKRNALARQRRLAFSRQFAHLILKTMEGYSRQFSVDTDHIVASEIGDHATKGGSYPWEGGYNDCRQMALAQKCRRVEGTSAAEGDQCEMARVVASLDRNEPDPASHVGVDDFYDSRGSSFGVKIELTPYFGGHRFTGSPAVQLDTEIAADRTLRIDPAEHEIGVSNGGFRSPLAVCHGTRHRP
ncbi:MAG TPA: hypothetical protein VNU19_02385, partial [Candidatus Acidoferrum sp.]|nr:hypothetical protein [Candidatus Acidoferrum sp.]